MTMTPGDYYASRDCADPKRPVIHVFAPDHREVAVMSVEQAARLGQLLSDENYQEGYGEIVAAGTDE